jgi:hypothetical protein
MVRAAVVLLGAFGMSSCDARHKGVPPHVDDLRELAYVKEIRVGSADNPDSGFSRIRTVRVSDK